MHIVQEQEFCEKAYPAFSKVFNCESSHSWNYVFTDLMSSRTIVFDTSNADINDAIPMQLIIDSARYVGDSACYFNILSPQLREPDFYYVPLDDLDLFYKWCNNQLDQKIVKEKGKIFSEWLYRYPLCGDAGSVSIFSENSRWGIVTNYCCAWGLVGGVDTFVSSLKRGLPDLEQQVFSFLLDFYIRCKSDKTNYLEQLISSGIKSDLEHIYGMKIATQIITMTPKELVVKSGENISDLVYPEFLSEYV